MSKRAIPETDEQAIAAAEFAAAGAVNERRRIDPKEAAAYNEYLKDWRWRMSTWSVIEREQFGSTRYPRTHHNLF